MTSPFAPRSRQLLTLAAAIGLTAVVALFGSISIARKVESFQPLGIVTRASAGGALGLEVVASQLPDLAVGDRILLANGEEVQDRVALQQLLAGKPEGTLLVHRADDLVEVRYVRPNLALDLPYLFLALAGIAYLLVGLYTILRRPVAPSRLFFLWCAAWAVVGIFTPTLALRNDAAGRAIFLIEDLARVFLAPLTLHLFLRFPGPKAGERQISQTSRRALPFLYLPAAVLAGLHLDLALTGGTWLFGPASSAALELFDRIDLVHWAAFALASLGVLLLRRREGEAEERRQRQWVAAGLAFGYLPFVAFYLLPWVFGATPTGWVRALAVAPLACVPLTFAYAILRYRLWDLGTIVRDASVSVLTLLLGVVGFSLANLAISRGVSSDLGFLRSVLTFLAGVSIAATLVPARRTLSAAFERFQHGMGYTRRRALAELGRELLHQRDLDSLCGTFLRRVQECFELERVNLYVAQGAHLVRVRPDTELPAQWRELALPPAIWARESLTLTGLALAGTAPGPTETMFAAGYRHALGLAVRGTPVGLLLLGHRADDSPLSGEDLALVRGLLDQAALAIENAQLLEQLHRQLDETTRLRQFNEGIIESSPAGIVVLSPDRRITSANIAFAALVGRERPQVIGERLQDVLTIDPLPESGAGLIEVGWCDVRSGVERHFQVGISPLEGSGGDLVLVLQDVSERFSFEEEMREKDRLAALGMLAAGVAHEVNTPITGISSYAQMLLSETAENDPRYELLKKVERQTFRASRIVNSLLDFARAKSGDMRSLELGQLVRESSELLKEQFAKRQVTIAVEPCDDGGLTVFANDGELQQVFTNLLLNAADAVAAKRGSITVLLTARGDRAVVAVEDDGPGIPAAVVERMFQPFFTTKVGQGGTGLGLSIAHNIVRRHGGELRVTSKLGQGTRFEVDLPRLGAQPTPTMSQPAPLAG